MRRAQDELDNVMGADNWPSAEDESRLPYLRAIIKEVRDIRNFCCTFAHGDSGTTCAHPVLDGYPPLFHRRLRLQGLFHSKGYSTGLELLYTSPQRGTLP